jgi:hypothetical protein
LNERKMLGSSGRFWECEVTENQCRITRRSLEQHLKSQTSSREGVRDFWLVVKIISAREGKVLSVPPWQVCK